MNVAISAMEGRLDAPFSPVFGRCPVFVIVDSATMAIETVPNLAMAASGGAGIQAAQDVARHEVGAVVTGSVGPNALQVLTAAQISIYTFKAGTVRQAVEDLMTGKLDRIATATRPVKAGAPALSAPNDETGFHGTSERA